MCVNNLSKVALDSAAAGIEPAISSRKSNDLTTTPPSHTMLAGGICKVTVCDSMGFKNVGHFLPAVISHT